RQHVDPGAHGWRHFASIFPGPQTSVVLKLVSAPRRSGSLKMESKVSAFCEIIGADEVIGDGENVIGRGRPGGGAHCGALLKHKSISPNGPGEDKLISEQSELQQR